MDEVEQQLSDKADIALFSFDIDRFKSINDTFGHDAGDIVLSSFAFRLNNFVSTLKDSYSATFIFGRPGGEEFELICVGAVSRQERIEIGDLFLHELRKPMVYEFATQNISAALKSEGSGNDISRLPSQVTASIGVAWTRGAEASNANSILSKLRKDADAALYRAKADGRNCLRAYDDIRRFHGRVLEYHGSSKLLQIDIGSKVGVKLGQIYTVFFPPFTGSEKIRTPDASSKILGNYPKLPSAKIQVISIEREFSTAIIIDYLTCQEIPVGSLLQYSPSGSQIFPHGRALASTAVTTPLSNLSHQLSLLKSLGSPYVLISLSWDCLLNSSPRKENQTEFYNLLRLYLPSSSQIFYSSGNPNFALIPNLTFSSAIDLKEKLKIISDSLMIRGYEVSIGAVYSELLPTHISDEVNAITFYANSALLSIQKNSPDIVVFDSNTPALTVGMWRNTRNSDEALVDYHNFRLYGFDSPTLDNQIGLAIIRSEATENFGLAEAAFSRAADNKKTSKVFFANLGLIQTLLGKYEDAVKNFENSRSFIDARNNIYKLALAKCELEIYKKNKKMAKDDLSNLLVSAIEPYSTAPAPPYDRLWMDVKSALREASYD